MTILTPPDNFLNAPPSVIGVILAGGQSSRMNTDKAALSINGVKNLERAVELLNNCKLDDVVISGQNYIEDHYKNGGPLSGILSVIQELKSENQKKAILVIPIDMPLLTPQLLNTLIEQGIKHNSACCYYSYNLPIYLPITEELFNFLNDEFLSPRFTKHNKGPSFKHLLKYIDCHFINTTNIDLLINANTPEQWNNILKVISRQ